LKTQVIRLSVPHVPRVRVQRVRVRIVAAMAGGVVELYAGTNGAAVYGGRRGTRVGIVCSSNMSGIVSAQEMSQYGSHQWWNSNNVRAVP
jgi:hypothetical protein